MVAGHEVNVTAGVLRPTVAKGLLIQGSLHVKAAGQARAILDYNWCLRMKRPVGGFTRVTGY